MSDVSGPESFFSFYARGDALAEEIDDHVDRWHGGDGPEGQPLHQYLGLTSEEYSAWVEDASVLPSIVVARNTRRTLADALSETGHDFRMAARASGPLDGTERRTWLGKHRSR